VEPHIFGKGVLAVQTVKAALVAAIAIVALVVSLLPGLAEESGSLAQTISIDGAIGPASASYVKDALARAGERRAEIVIVRLNTPGAVAVRGRTSRRAGEVRIGVKSVPRRGRPRCRRHDLPAGWPLCPQSAADQLCRPRLDAGKALERLIG
jgi:hypothetical protein